jgi:hypothetical protein
MDYTELSDIYSRNMYGAGRKKAYDSEAYDRQYGAGRKKAYDPEAYDRQYGAGRKKAYDSEAYDRQYGAGRKKAYDPEAYDRQYGAGHDHEMYDEQYGAGHGYSHDQYGGADFTEAECRQWLADNFTNPKTGRKIGPTKSGTGAYYDLQKACLIYAPRSPRGSSSSLSSSSTSSSYFLQEAPPIHAQALKKTVVGDEIIRTTGGRKSPSVSATSLPVGTKRAGNDGQMYIIKLRANSTQYWQPCSQKTANC